MDHNEDDYVDVEGLDVPKHDLGDNEQAEASDGQEEQELPDLVVVVDTSW
jgi:hypothetical protein